MNHLTDEELLQHYYGEGRPEDTQHLAACPACFAAFATLREDMEQISSAVATTVPLRDAEQVWNPLRASLIPHASKPNQKRSWFHLRRSQAWTLAAVTIAVILAAFLAGRQWQASHTPPTAAANHGPDHGPDPQSRQRVIILVLGDHLDRSERLLVELSHPDQAVGDPALQSTARELLTENRLYRQSAAPNTADADQSLTGTLDDLEQLLDEVANNPDSLSRAEIQQIQKEMNTGALLFEVRVLRNRLQQQSAPANIAPEGSI